MEMPCSVLISEKRDYKEKLSLHSRILRIIIFKFEIFFMAFPC